MIKGARQHNLKNISIDIPKNKLVVFTGISGSGKSSLAFDTIYADGQRRYVESLSSYARQFLGMMEKPDVDSIEGLSPAISIDQKSSSSNPRSTVGTQTEIYDYLRLLFARVGHPHCPNCNLEIAPQSIDRIVDHIINFVTNEFKNRMLSQLRLMILSPVVREKKGEFDSLLTTLKVRGYRQTRIDRTIYDLSDDINLIKTNKHTIEVVCDRLSIDRKMLKDISFANLLSRLTDAVEQSLSLSDGLVVIAKVVDKSFSFPAKPKKFVDFLYSERLSCPKCNLSLPEIEPRIFSFNTPFGACGMCTGIGTLMKVNEDLIINPELSISEGGILPFSSQFQHHTWFARLVFTVCQKENIDIHAPLKNLKDEQRKVLFYGTADTVHRVVGLNRQGVETAIYETFPGIIPELERRYSETTSTFIRAEIEKYLKEKICPQCQGTRLKKESLSITINGQSIADVCSLSIEKAVRFLRQLEQNLNPMETKIAELILKEISSRLNFLSSVGLSYLTLDRRAASLAGGEAQRIRLASQIGSGLSGVVYVLDEPSIGLHQRDNKRLILTLKKLRDLGNTVIVVEHDRELMENADFIVDFGPGAGNSGGKIVAAGSPVEIKKNKKSLTGHYLSGRKKINLETSPSSATNGFLTIKGCRQFNLKNIDVSFPLGKLILVTGVSGSGKSTLVVETLYHALKGKLNPYYQKMPGSYQSLEGDEFIDKVILIDQSPIGRTPRSNPATYCGVFTDIRHLYSQLPDSRARGYRPGRFSFNVKGGRCETCGGEGQLKIEMHFLPDVYVNCEVCHGRRFNRETLEVHFKGKSIADVLSMTVEEAAGFFSNQPPIVHKLDVLKKVGLSYIALGQPAPTLSGGEAQRVKLATHLAKKTSGKAVYILDEPTTGLHFADLEKLINVLKVLTLQGNTVIVIEHNLDVIKNADWVIDLGPEGGDLGGRIVVYGEPHSIAQSSNSYTGQFLRDILR